MQVELARRYSRTQGLTRWDSETWSSGACCRSRDSTRSSWQGLAMDHRKQTATASIPSATSRSATSTTFASSRPRTHRAARIDPFGDLEGERSLDEGLGIGNAVIEERQAESPRLAQHHDVAVALGGEQRGAWRPLRSTGRSSPPWCRERSSRARRAARTENSPREADISSRPFSHAGNEIIGDGRILVCEVPVSALQHEVGAGAADVDADAARGLRRLRSRHDSLHLSERWRSDPGHYP